MIRSVFRISTEVYANSFEQSQLYEKEGKKKTKMQEMKDEREREGGRERERGRDK